MIVTILDNLENITDEYILYNHNFIKSEIERALNIVKDYIIKHKLLIVGGTAIDYALKLNGDTLYNDLYQVPDFDIMSPNNIEHANSIGKILCESKFKNISIIPAIHHTTMRVQLLGFTVFDSTFVPVNIYNKLPYLIYNEFKFIHPVFQKINQYLSLSFLFKITGPSYNILNRFKKDISRFDMVEKYYKIDKSLIESENIEYNFESFSFQLDLINLINIKSFKNKNDNIIIYNTHNIAHNGKQIYHEINKDNNSYNISSDITFHGICAYNIIYKEFIELYNNLLDIINIKDPDIQYINSLYENILIHTSYKIKEKNIIFQASDNSEICFINNNTKLDKIQEKLEQLYKLKFCQKLDNILDLKPKNIECRFKQNDKNHKVIIYDLYGDLVNINLIYDKKNNIFLPITSYNYNLMYFLTNYYLYEDNPDLSDSSNLDLKNLYLSYYISLKSIIEIIQYIYYNYTNEFEKNEYFTNSIFNYSINTLGDDNYPDNFYYFIENFKYLVKNNKNLNVLPPKNYIGYPKCDIHKIFDLEMSPYYSNEQKNITYTNASNIINDFELN